MDSWIAVSLYTAILPLTVKADLREDFQLLPCFRPAHIYIIHSHIAKRNWHLTIGFLGLARLLFCHTIEALLSPTVKHYQLISALTVSLISNKTEYLLWSIKTQAPYYRRNLFIGNLSLN